MQLHHLRRPTLLTELGAIFVVGGAYLILHYIGEMGQVLAFLNALSAWFIGVIAYQWLMRGAAPPDTSPWKDMNLDDPGSQARMQMLFQRYGVTGSMNVRDGRVVAVVPPSRLTPIAKQLVTSVGLLRSLRHNGAGADLFVRTTDGYHLIDLTVDDIEYVSVIIERVIEDRKQSRRLYKGFDDNEVIGMARTAVSDYIRRQPDIQAGDSMILSNAIRRGECDSHPFVQTGIHSIRFLLQIKGNDA